MKTAQLSGSLRANVGKKDAASLRLSGRVPCVLYGQGSQTHFSVKQIDIEKLVFSPDVYQIELDIEGKKARGVIQELQQHPLKDSVQHVDFLELNDTKAVKVKLPVRVKGSSKGVMNGGKLMLAFRHLQCVGLPGDLPEEISVDITNLKIGDSIRVKSINYSGVTFLDPANAVVVAVKMARGAAQDSDEDEAEGSDAEGTEQSSEAAE